MRFRPNRPARPRRRGLGLRPALSALLLPQLAEANRQRAAGALPEAARAYSELAQQAAHDGQYKRAVHLHLHAGEACAAAGDGQRALAEARAALAWLKRLGRDRRAGQLGWRIVDGLRGAGLVAEAEALAHELASDVGQPEPALAAAARGRLPAQCPQCAAPVRSDEVEWIDDQSAECTFCGSTLLTED